MTNSRILVVEDDPDGREMVATMLEHMNFPVDVVGNAEDAMDHLFGSNTVYRAVIIDLALPGMDGWELLAEILNNPNTTNIPCVAVTAFHAFKMREDAIRAGFSAYLPKPIDSMVLGRELERLIS
jgi:CheY-like chemotaxis protein